MIVRHIKPATDSHFRLCDCGCGGEAEYLEFDTGLWAAQCSVCRRRGKLHRIRHTVQVRWNQEERHG